MNLLISFTRLTGNYIYTILRKNLMQILFWSVKSTQYDILLRKHELRFVVQASAHMRDGSAYEYSDVGHLHIICHHDATQHLEQLVMLIVGPISV